MRTFRYPQAGKQHGLIRTQQIGRDSAAIRRAVLDGSLFPKYRGVYAVGHPKLSREGEWLAAVYAAGDGAALTGFAGAAYWKISRFRARTIQVAVPKRRRAQPGFAVVPDRLLPDESFVRDAIPVCTVPRVVFDLSRELPPEQLANVIHEAAFIGRWEEPTRTNPVLRRAIALHESGSAGTRSGLEDRFLRLVGRARLPEPIVNTPHLGFELDFRWPGLNVEIDGDQHDRPRDRLSDHARDAVLRERGFVVLRFREHDLDRPGEVLRQLAAQDLPCGVAR